MPRQVTTVLEFRAAGILLKKGKHHEIRVLGAHKEVPKGTRLQLHHAEPPHLEPQEGAVDHDAEYAPRVPDVFVTAEGEPVRLKRDWS